MKLPANQINNFIKKPTNNGVLIYGPDRGQTDQYIKNIIKSILGDQPDPLSIIDINFDKLKDDPAFLADEMGSISLFGGRKVIRIRDAKPTIAKELSDILENTDTTHFIIFSAFELTPASALRKYFEKSPKYTTIASYKDDQASIARVISSYLQENGFTFERDVISWISSYFSGDRMVIIRELEKLITYKGEDKNITINDAQQCITDSAEISLSQLCNAVASRDVANINRNINRAIQEGTNSIAIIRAVLNYFSRLNQVKSLIEQGVPQAQAVSSLRPPVFFKEAPTFNNHIGKWNTNSLRKIISSLTELEISCKTTGNPADLLCTHFLTVVPGALR
ncbi:DNA polymerase III subunit delta [Rickettsiales bacterium]|nr:DNA polymerase III subunit delta [Rickettsiales bacterium]